MEGTVNNIVTCDSIKKAMPYQINQKSSKLSLDQNNDNNLSASFAPKQCSTIGHHLARRLVEVGVKDVFSVPGDFNLGLLDHLVAEPGLNLVGCCNELNAGYAADGYARSRGVAACAVTFTVGGLSILNAIAGAYSDDLPVICIVGGPNSNDYGANNILHHTIGLPDFNQELRCFQPITCYQSGIPHPTFLQNPMPLFLSPKLSNQMALELAAEAAAEFLNKATKPVMVGGPKLRPARASSSFLELAEASGYPIAVMPSVKGFFPENHPHFIGTYWGTVSTPFCAETVESSDAYLIAGPVFSDCTSVGYSLLLKKERTITVQPHSVTIGNGPIFGCVEMKDFLKALANRVKRNACAYESYKRIRVTQEVSVKCDPKEEIKVSVLFNNIEKMLSGETTLIAETGVPWFSCQQLKLPQGCGLELEMQYGSTGWSVGATLGYAQAAPNKRVIACIGDGSFQMTAQELSTMLRCGQTSIIFLINNGGYSIEAAIHDGPYNVIKNWNYTGLVDAIHNGEGKCWTTKVTCEEELVAAIVRATSEKRDCLCFIEVIVHKHDTSKELLELCSRISAASIRPPNHI
ncbi:Pyruvate decarboxylase isozyme 2 [Morus notabilis]|uniref:pyruvate decarboxylase n=1 Tax=Morus notabilis TaxID=981085 RepID=W9SNR5_9ROSA|nr:pyruvate decarboxylase 2 [Morus notabilis]EXC36324.1 Pyruvate decarboxylase isozyme 2 [Morus notabilis]